MWGWSAWGAGARHSGMSQPCRVIVINLDRDVERLAHIGAELARAGIAFERFAAIDGDMLPGWLRRYLGDAEATLSRGEIGCYASHLAVCRDVEEQGAPALVLEDDVALPADFGALLSVCLRLCRQAGISCGSLIRVSVRCCALRSLV